MEKLRWAVLASLRSGHAQGIRLDHSEVQHSPATGARKSGAPGSSFGGCLVVFVEF